MDVVGLLNNINDKADMFAVKTWTSEWTNSFQDNQGTRSRRRKPSNSNGD